MTTRNQFYTRRNGGGYRTARSVHVCQQSLCLNKVQPGEKYFDTREFTTWPRTKLICSGCAEEDIGDL